MKTIYYNAKVYVEREKFAEAVVTEDGIITKVGTNDEALSMIASGDSVIDCYGKTMIPGLNDSHNHLLLVGELMNKPDINNIPSLAEMIERCKKYIDNNPELAKKGIHTTGWNQDLFTDEKRIPTRFDLDKISTEIPILLERICGHVASSNTKAIEMLGIDGSSAQFEGGEFEIGEDGYPNGIFKANAVNIIKEQFPQPDEATIELYLKSASDYAVSVGITTVQSNDVGSIVLNWKKYLKMFRDYYASGKGKLRFHHQVCFTTIDEFKEYIETEYKNKEQLYPEGSWLTLGPLKLFQDGSLGARTAQLRKPYEDDPNAKGASWATKEQMDEFCQTAADAGMQIVTHVIGDGAIEDVVKHYEKTFDKEKNPLRHSLIHCQITDRPLLERIAKDGILVSYQPCFLDYDMRVVEARCGKELASTSYAFKTMDELSPMRISYGTDAPVEDCNPWANIYFAVTRKTADGTMSFHTEECVDVYTAIDAYTINSAYAEFKENTKGRIKEGYVADLTLMDKDIFTCPVDEIKDIKALMTIVDGKCVYQG